MKVILTADEATHADELVKLLEQISALEAENEKRKKQANCGHDRYVCCSDCGWDEGEG